MAMLRLYCTTVLVTDQARALEFYVGQLGFDKVDDAPMGPDFRWIVVAPPGAESGFALLLPSNVGRPDATVGGFTGISLTTDDVQKSHAELSAKGARFDGPPQKMPWGGLGVSFLDPDGNSFFLSERT